MVIFQNIHDTFNFFFRSRLLFVSDCGRANSYHCELIQYSVKFRIGTWTFIRHISFWRNLRGHDKLLSSENMEKEVLFFIMQVDILLHWSCKHHRNCTDANHKFLDDCTGQILTWSDMWNVPYAGSCYDQVALSIFIETFAWLVFQYGQNRWHSDLFCYRSCFGCIKSSSLLAHNFHNSWHNRGCSNHHGILLHSSRTGRFDIKKLKLIS